jgi:hypothetical protein
LPAGRCVDQDGAVSGAHQPGMHADDEGVGRFIIVIGQQPVANAGDELGSEIGERGRLLDEQHLFDAGDFEVADFDHERCASVGNSKRDAAVDHDVRAGHVA